MNVFVPVHVCECVCVCDTWLSYGNVTYALVCCGVVYIICYKLYYLNMIY